MQPVFRVYDSKKDFLCVRDMLIETYAQFEKPLNWTMERWQYARHFCAPMLGAYGLDSDSGHVLENNIDKSKEAIELWESAIGIWTNEQEETVALVCPDEYVPWHPGSNLAYIQRRPGYDYLLDEMLDYAATKYVQDGITRLWVTSHDIALTARAQERGYTPSGRHPEYWMEIDLADLPDAQLPEGFRFQSMADSNDLEKRRKVLGLSFYHKDAREWATIFSYQELQKAPDYRKDLDLVVVAPHSEFVSCCIVWVDTYNKIAMLEPVGSIVLGMGREVVMEGLRRARGLGARTGIMTSALTYYEKIGFKKKHLYGTTWSRKVR
jgi:predicted N-acetyltransferase YhbS